MHPLWNGVQAAFHRPDTAAYRVVQGATWALIALSVALLAVEALLPEGRSGGRLRPARPPQPA